MTDTFLSHAEGKPVPVPEDGPCIVRLEDDRKTRALRYVLQFLDEYDVDRKFHPSLRQQVEMALREDNP
jgi:hypothetical protein